MVKVAFDQSQKERGSLTTIYTELKRILEENGFEPLIYNEYPIREEAIRNIDIFVMACPTDSKLMQSEIDALVSFVREGGGLLLLSNASGDSGQRTNLSELASYFGIKFQNDQVLDPQNNLGTESLPIIEARSEHPILAGVSRICYRSGCSLSVSDNAIPVLITEPTAEPPNAPVMAVSEYHKGRIVALGSYTVFRDSVKGGILTADNRKLALNIFKWLAEKKAPPTVVEVPARKLEERVAVLENEVKEIKRTLQLILKKLSIEVPTPVLASEEIAKAEAKEAEITPPPKEIVEKVEGEVPIVKVSKKAETAPKISKKSEEVPTVDYRRRREEIERALEKLQEDYKAGKISKTQYALERARLKRKLAEL